MHTKPNRGFTLIELMVVISIIGLIASVTLSALNTARAKARDARKIQEFSEIRKALTLYYDANGRYPIAPIAFVTARSYTQSSSWSNTWETTLKPLLAPGYIPNLPIDTSPGAKTAINPFTWWGTDGSYSYVSDATGSQYQIFTRLETNHPLRCATQNYRAKFSSYWTAFSTGASFCSGAYSATNADLYVVSSD